MESGRPVSDVHEYYNDLDATFEHAWQALADAVTDRRHGFRTVQLATSGQDGTPNIRSLVLRGVDRPGYALQLHTDVRSAKVMELRAQPRVALHAYDPHRKLQLRLYGLAQLHEGDTVASSAWARAPAMSRVCYRIQPAPGSVIADPREPFHAIAPAQPDPGQASFAVISVIVDSLEWLYLAHPGHRRARWQRRAGQWSGNWLVP